MVLLHFPPSLKDSNNVEKWFKTLLQDTQAFAHLWERRYWQCQSIKDHMVFLLVIHISHCSSNRILFYELFYSLTHSVAIS